MSASARSAAGNWVGNGAMLTSRHRFTVYFMPMRVASTSWIQLMYYGEGHSEEVIGWWRSNAWDGEEDL